MKTGSHTAYILAASMVPFGKYPERSVADLGRDAIREVLRESAVPAQRVEAVYSGRAFGGAIDGQVAVPAQVALRGTGIEDVPVFNLDNACAAGASALNLATHALRSGQHDIVLVVGMDKLFSTDRRQSMRALFGAMDVQEMAWIGETLEREGPVGSVFMENYYAKVAREYLHDTGAFATDYAKVAVKNRAHASRNPYAQYRRPISEDEVMASPVVAEPLRSLMCSPLTDGAAAMLLCSGRVRASLGGRPVEIAASVVRSGRPALDSGEPVLSRASRKAYEEAGIEPGDLDLLEVHDASAVAELIATEQILLQPRGEALRMLRGGCSALGGKLPVNPSGGLLSRGHPGAATGASQIVEIVWQLQGRAEGRQVDDARIGLAHSSGGSVGSEPAATAVTILRRT